MVEKVVTVIMCLFSVIAYGIATTIPPPFVQTPLSAGFWPKLVLTIIFVASALHLVRLFFRKKEVEEYLAREAEEAKKKEEEETGEREMLPLFLFGTIHSFLYIVSVGLIGFTLATPIFMAIFMYVTGFRKKIMIAVVSLSATAVFLLLFVKLTFIPLPRGYGIFRSISYLIY
jgi:putative tricarboxylic transport membrane protein